MVGERAVQRKDRRIVIENVRRMLLQEYLMKQTRRAGFGGLDIQRTPMGTRVTLIAERPGLVIGRKGGAIKALTEAVERQFNFDNPQIEVRRKREFTYRGYTLDEMKAMTLQEIIELLPARPRRTYRRGLDEQQTIFVERFRGAAWTEKGLRTHCRDVPILPDFVGKKVSIHNGKAFETVEIKAEMIGHYLGEFAMTRKPVKHSGPGVGATRSSKFMPLK